MFHTESDHAFWKKVLANIELEVGKPAFLLYFKNTVAEVSKRSLKIFCPSAFIKEGLEKNFKNLLLKTVRGLSPHPLAVEFALAPPKEAKNPKDYGPIFSVKKGLFYPDFTFESFIVGEENELAYAVAKTIAQGNLGFYNPLLIHSTSGLGKTHLLHAIGHQMSKKFPRRRVVYARSEEFTTELIGALRERKRLQIFKEKYRSSDLLMLDDTQFFAGKKVSQEELFNTLNFLLLSERQVVVASDNAPQDLGLEKRIASRFLGGLTVEISEPGLELRRKILKNKAQDFTLFLSEEEFTLLAEKVKGSIRELEGVLLKIKAGQEVLGGKTKVNLKKSLQEVGEAPYPEKILSAVCEVFLVKKEDLLSEKKEKPIAFARKAACLLLRELTSFSFSQIGEVLGEKHHTTILYNLARSKTLLTEDPSFKEKVSSARLSVEKK